MRQMQPSDEQWATMSGLRPGDRVPLTPDQRDLDELRAVTRVGFALTLLLGRHSPPELRSASVADYDWWIGFGSEATPYMWIPHVGLGTRIEGRAFSHIGLLTLVPHSDAARWRWAASPRRPLRVAFVDSATARVVGARDFWLPRLLSRIVTEFLLPPRDSQSPPDVWDHAQAAAYSYIEVTHRHFDTRMGTVWAPLLPAPEDPPVVVNGFGLALSPAGHADDIHRLGRSAPAPSKADTDALVAEAKHRIRDVGPPEGWPADRWLYDDPAEPCRISSADVPALTAHYAESAAYWLPSIGRVPPRTDTKPQALAEYLTAQPYWLPPGAEAPLLSGRPVDDDEYRDLRMPHRSCIVWFARPLAVPPGAVPDLWPTIRGSVSCATNMHRRTHNCRPTDSRVVHALTLATVRPEHCWVEGVRLIADDEGRPTDRVEWLLRIPTPPVWDMTSYWVVVPGNRDQSAWAAPLRLLTALVAWGSWQPEPSRSGPGTQPSTPRANGHGPPRGRPPSSDPPVLVLAAPTARTPDEPPSTAAAAARPARQSPVTHLRRGHFRRQRIGPRSGQDYRMRWIPPTVVNPGSAASPLRVYTLPAPDEASSPSEVDRCGR